MNRFGQPTEPDQEFVECAIIEVLEIARRFCPIAGLGFAGLGFPDSNPPISQL